MESLQPQPDAASIAESMPYLLKALANPDIPLHTFALTAIAGLQTAPPPERAASTIPPLGDPTTPAPASVAPIGPSAPTSLTLRRTPRPLHLADRQRI